MPDETLLDAVYEAAADDQAFAALPGAIAQAFGAGSAWLLKMAPEQAVAFQHNIDPDFAAPYTAHYWRKDPWYLIGPDLPYDTAQVIERYVERSTYEKSEVYNELGRPFGDILYCMGLQFRDAGSNYSFALLRTRRSDAFQTSDEPALQALLPHLKRLMRTRERLRSREQRLLAAQRLHDSVADALFLVDRQARVLARNAAADVLIAAGEAALDRAGVLTVRGQSGATLHRRIRQAADAPGLSAQVSVCGAEGGLRLAVDPAGPGEACVVVRDVEAHRTRAVSAAARLWGLTAAEAAVVGLLLEGVAPADQAERRGVAVSTVRAQIRSIFGKSELSRQSDLLAAVSDLPGR